ncbi:MAG: elongation factor P [Clostridia bacterium]
MISAGDFRKGVTFEMDGGVWTVTEFLHVKPGKGSPFVRTKLKNIMTGQGLERTFNPTDKFQVAVIEKKEMQYLYNDGELYYFMDNETYEQIPLNKNQVEDALNFMVENMVATIQFFKGSAFSVVPPLFVELLITDTEPGMQGDTSKAGYKPAILETGYKINVPLFVNSGEKIKVDTRDGSYLERVK